MRLFIAVDIPDDVRNNLSSFRISDDTATVKWVDEKNIHITMKFLGDVDENKVDAIIESLGNVEISSFRCLVKGFGAFPNENYAKVLWAGAESEGKITELHEMIDSALEHLGFNRERKFHPHLTTGRVRFIKDKERLKQFITDLKTKDFGNEFSVDCFSLRKSTLTSNGPVYEDVKTFH